MNQTQGNNFRDIVRFEDDSPGRLSREVVEVASGQNLVMGAVLGRITKSTPAAGTPDIGNTGAGTCTGVTAGAKAKVGAYRIKCLTYVADPLSAAFEVKDPGGNLLPDAGLGAYVNEQINFTMADGSPVIAVGDIWTVTVAQGGGQVRAIGLGALQAVDGSQNAYGILTDDCDASLGAKDAVAIVKDAVVIEANLRWPAGEPAVTGEEKAAAMAELRSKGIVARDEA